MSTLSDYNALLVIITGALGFGVTVVLGISTLISPFFLGDFN
jgi:hypothetical protein